MLCEIPIPDGWEFIGYRKAKNEFILDGHVPYKFEKESTCEHIVIRKQWQPPDFLPDGWIAMDANGMWDWSPDKPRMRHDDWYSEGYCGLSKFIWERPPVTDWKESLREIKRGAK